jgi:hypothetical protein
VLDELELLREDAKLGKAERDAAVGDLINLVVAVDGILQAQAKADTQYFCQIAGLSNNAERAIQIEATVLKAYRWQYIVSGVKDERFQKILGGMVTEAQMKRIGAALAPILS